MRDLAEMDLGAAADVLEFCDMCRAAMVEDFHADGRFESNGVSFGGYAFGTCEVLGPETEGGPWRSGPKLDRVYPMPLTLPPSFQLLIPPAQQTLFFSKALRLYAGLAQAVGVMIMAETWMVHLAGDGDKPRPGETARDHALRVRDGLPDNLEDAPGRFEYLFMTCEHRALGRKQWRALIEREPDRVGPWEEMDWSAGAFGRLVDILDKAEKREEL